jgi:hypothetical protein
MNQKRPSNPYRFVHRRIASRRPKAWGGILVVVSAICAAPLAEPSLLSFLRATDIGPGIEGLCFRLAALIAAAMAIRTYTDVVRGEDRPILDAHPVEADRLLSALALRSLRHTIAWPFAASALLWPMATAGEGQAAAWMALVILSAWGGMIGFGYAVHLGAVWASRSPQAAGWLDLLRGSNPREQAAFIYAPGFALFSIGLAIGLASSGARLMAAGHYSQVYLCLLPALLGLVSWPLSKRLAVHHYVPATAVLGEIDARWASIEEGDSAQDVYLDWLANDRAELLRSLRQGWRRLRIWPVGAWVLGGLAAISAWSGDHRSAVLISGVGVCLVSSVPASLASGDPPWLDLALGVDARKVFFSRLGTGWLYAQGAVLPACAMVLFKNGLGLGLPALFLLELLALSCSAISSGLAHRMRGQAHWVYAPLSLLIWACIGGVI